MRVGMIADLMACRGDRSRELRKPPDVVSADKKRAGNVVTR